MDALLYVETNYLMGVATGRYELALLLGATGPRVKMAIPHSCFMESLTAVEVAIARRKRLSRVLKRRSEKLRTEIFLPQAANAVGLLEAARLENDLIVDEVRQRLLTSIERLTTDAERVAEPNEVLVRSTRDALTAQPTDNFVLHAILHDAAQRRGATLAFFTENKKDFVKNEAARDAIKAAGVTLHSLQDRALAWMQHAVQP